MVPGFPLWISELIQVAHHIFQGIFPKKTCQPLANDHLPHVACGLLN